MHIDRILLIQIDLEELVVSIAFVILVSDWGSTGQHRD